MKQPSRVALQLLLAAGAVVATGTAASAEAPPCKGWRTAAEHTSAGPIPAFESFCNGVDGGYAFKQGFPIKWQ